MFLAITAFELRYQIRNPVFGGVALLFFLLTFGAVTVEQISIGSGGNVHVNSPYAIVQIHLILSIFFMFVTTAFAANVVVRDDESGFAPIVRTTQVKKRDYLLGRLAGAVAASSLAFLVVPLAIFLGSMMPWIDPETLGPNRLIDYALAYGLLAVPNVILTACLFFAVATLTRSTLYAYLGVIVFLIAYLVAISMIAARPELRGTASIVFEPFGIAAHSHVTRYWTPAERNSLPPPVTGALLMNRVLWLSVGAAFVALAVARFRLGERPTSARALRRAAKREAKIAARSPRTVERLPSPNPGRAAWPRLLERAKFEAKFLIRSPAFIVLVAAGLFNAGGALWFANEIYGTPARPATFALVDVVKSSFSIIPVIIAIFYAGELVWRDRDRRMHEIIDSTALPGWAYLLPKVLALSSVLGVTLAAGMLAGVFVQLSRGFMDVRPAAWATWYILPGLADMLLLAVLAVFVQALAPNKYIGWAVMVVYLVAQITLSNLGYEHPLYTFGDAGQARFSDMNGDEVGRLAGRWLRVYWGFVALVLGVVAHLLWRRGNEVRLAPRLLRLPASLRSRAGALLGLGVVGAALSGAVVFYNTNVLNRYVTEQDIERTLAELEKTYLKYESVPQPVAAEVSLRLDLFPLERRLEAAGTTLLINRSIEPVTELHLRTRDPRIDLVSVDVPGARLALDDKRLGYWIYELGEPLPPGGTIEIGFVSRRGQAGFPARREDTGLVANGIFLNNGDFAPVIGMDRSTLLSDRVKRRRYGLPAELRPAKLEDLSATARSYVGNASWVSARITVSTDASQVPLAPGVRVKDETTDGRRTSVFVSKGPILSFFSVQSADYAEATAEADGVSLSVFHDRRHPWNIERMLKTMRASLDYYRREFGPYPLDHARIVEFPGYASFAQAFAGTMPYSESIGFLADTSDPDAIDYPTYITAHELAHQYWAHQLVGADMQGATLLSETLAQYSALMVMKELFGPDQIRRFLKYELDNYLRSRGGEPLEELPLVRVENQPYVHYRKGSLVMYLVADRLGEDRVNALLARLLEEWRFKGPPYPRSTVLVDGLKALARSDAELELLEDLLERITLYDLKAQSARTRVLPDGRFETSLEVELSKAYADGFGVETPAPLQDEIDVGLFLKRPGHGAFSGADVLLLERRPVKDGVTTLLAVTDERPAYAGIDPYNKYVDRNSDDNVVAVER